MKKFKKTQNIKPTTKLSLVKEFPVRYFEKESCDNNILKRVLADLSNMRRRKKELPIKSYCQLENFKEKKLDCHIRLRCRQLPSVVQHLRKAIMKQDWDEVTTLLIILCHPGLKHYESIIMKVCFILLFNHSNSHVILLQNFIRLATEYILDEDVHKFIRILFALRKSPLIPLKSGKYIRKMGDYKITMDAQFEKF